MTLYDYMKYKIIDVHSLDFEEAVGQQKSYCIAIRDNL